MPRPLIKHDSAHSGCQIRTFLGTVIRGMTVSGKAAYRAQAFSSPGTVPIWTRLGATGKTKLRGATLGFQPDGTNRTERIHPPAQTTQLIIQS